MIFDPFADAMVDDSADGVDSTGRDVAPSPVDNTVHDNIDCDANLDTIEEDAMQGAEPTRLQLGRDAVKLAAFVATSSSKRRTR